MNKPLNIKQAKFTDTVKHMGNQGMDMAEMPQQERPRLSEHRYDRAMKKNYIAKNDGRN